jgi:hypothetical protein
MNETRIDALNRLCESGRAEEAAREFRIMAEEANDPDSKAALLINEHKCYIQISRLDKASEIMLQIRALPGTSSSE